ncbi:MAG TPA: GNAT family N-acetyltransferase [Thermoleophilia bacterium]
MSIRDLVWRAAEAGDADAVIAAITEWWPGIHMVHAVCPQLFAHFGDTCIIVEDDGRLTAFLVGFMSQRFPDAGYIHYAGVHPDHRGGGLGIEMYTRFAEVTRARGRTEVLAETGAWNVKSIAFHKRVGFTLEPGDEIVDGTPVHHDTTGHGFDYVEMVWRLNGERGGGA